METKLCTIIGFGGGMGAAIAEVFARAGFDLALLSRNPEKHAAAASALNASGVRVQEFAADAADEESLNAACAKIKETLGDT
ncbi:MAG: SDR family NAD(P)-dependent oxidoreductase, partial [Verrucomicrobiota bacterium]|nr:SDR family NAD(P)-dependent oxidoreductase [Verrucomicrobiota bacterium]